MRCRKYHHISVQVTKKIISTHGTGIHFREFYLEILPEKTARFVAVQPNYWDPHLAITAPERSSFWLFFSMRNMEGYPIKLKTVI